MNPWTFVVAADPQAGSPRSFRYAPAWVENWRTALDQIRAIGPEFMAIAGDLVRDGFHRTELVEFRQGLDSLPFPVRVIAGNMDTGNKTADHNSARRLQSRGQFTDLELNISSAKLARFADVFGPAWWTFAHRNVRVSGVTDMVINSGLPEEAAFWEWADGLASLPAADHHVWVLHYAPFVDQPDEANWDIEDPAHWLDWYFCIDRPGRDRLLALVRRLAGRVSTRVISGHIHCRRSQVFDGVFYDKAPATSFHQWADRWPDGDPALGFLRYDVSDDGLACAFVPLTRESTAASRGPGGHPNPAFYEYPEGRKLD